MCQFSGWVGPISENVFQRLVLYTGEEPNIHACGLALHNGQTVSVFKKPGAAAEAMRSEAMKSWLRKKLPTKAGLIHARLATHGSPLDNKNNHPHWTENGSVLVHKGVVHPRVSFNDARSECDSEQLLLSLEELGLVRGIQNCPGWIHTAYIPADDQRTIWLFTNSGSLELLKVNQTYVFSTRALAGGQQIPYNTWVGITLNGEVKDGPTVYSPRIWTPKINWTSYEEIADDDDDDDFSPATRQKLHLLSDDDAPDDEH